MRITLRLNAFVSQISVTSRKSFEKLDKTPSTVFQYYYQLQLKSLYKSGLSAEILEPTSNSQSSLRRYVRKEWESLSMSKKRVYHALYFHFIKLNYKELSPEEFAKRLELSIPISSEYLLFRTKFKVEFDKIWKEQYKKDHHGRSRRVYLRTAPSNLFKTSRVISGTINSFEYDSTRQFQEMCRQCRKVWRDKVTSDQKAQMAKILQKSRRDFELKLEQEIKLLDSLQNALHKLLAGPSANLNTALDFERPVTQSHNSVIALLLAAEKKE
ncbi:LAQU0S07e01398g1_1 [Lachancea quebecensis]|uniref:LAQU0S07e01398g1_1 n=1 Tax=Lachancea quebecensis TaxID=1654605 RepID=A0A0P1KT80_9SACH|nr:LAQU0S07e01398g1_1 [Lachancea quebecensis]